MRVVPEPVVELGLRMPCAKEGCSSVDVVPTEQITRVVIGAGCAVVDAEATVLSCPTKGCGDETRSVTKTHPETLQWLETAVDEDRIVVAPNVSAIAEQTLPVTVVNDVPAETVDTHLSLVPDHPPELS